MAFDRLLVPVANPETVDRLLDTAVDVAADRGLDVLVLNVVTVPMQLSLEQARREIDIADREALLADAVERARGYDVKATGRIRFGRSVAGGIRSVAAEDDVAAVLLGWRGRPRRRDVVLGSHIDEVLAAAPCDVLVQRIANADVDAARDLSSVLVPVAGGRNTALAARVAGSLVRAHDARVELLSVVPDGDENEDAVADARSMLARTSDELGTADSVTETVLTGPVVDTIVDRAADHDVTVIGAADGGLLRRVLVGDIPEAVGREADGRVIVAKREQSVPETVWQRVRAWLPFILSNNSQ